MTEEVKQETMEVEQEEGEILEDGEIADDEDDIVAIGQSSLGGPGAATKDEKENKESNQSKFGGTFSSYYPMDREDHFKPNKRKKKNNNKKRKRSNSIEAKRKQPGDQSHNAVDISDCINDTTFDSVELSDEDEYNFDMIDFDVLMEILGCTASKELVDSVPVAEKSKMMLRIMKIIKQLQGNDPNTSRRFARLKRRTKERPISNGNLGPIIRPPVYKAICKFYLEGKCHKGVDCHFSHDCVVPKRKELCKFYLQGFCGKGDDCLFMHGEFPCKFYHTNTECYSGENCRFSHAPLTEETREILRSYLDSGTLPDDPKPPPFRKLHKSLDRANIANKQQQQQQQLPQQQNFADPGEGDSAEFDSSFNKETEQLLSKPRPVILGDPTPKMKTSYSTWTWQQELKELEKAYTGLKKNLFCIDEIFAITEKPPTPRLEDDEDEVEAQILNYYNDMLDTDEMDEMLAVREIEEHQRKVREEEESLKDKEPFVDNTTVLPGSSEMGDEISEEEKRLIEASAHDEDLRILPGMSNAFLAAPPAINPVFDQVSYAPNVTTNSYFSPGDPFAIQSPFNGPDSFNGICPAEIKSEPAAAYPDPFGKPPPDLTAADVSSMVRQIRNGTIGTEPPPVTSTAIPTAVGAPPVKPEYRDPRLNRAKDPRSQANASGSSSQAALPLVQVEEKPVHKPFIKLCNPNVIVDYKMVLIRLSTINYACYYDMYMTDSSMKNDPRLRKFFSDQKPANTDLEYSAPSVATIKSEPENTFMTLPALNLPPAASATVLGTPPMSNGIVKPPADLAAKEKSELLPASPPVSRDPRIRSKEMDRSRTSDLQIEQVDNKSPPSVETTKTAPEAATTGGGEEESKESTLNSAELTNGDDKEEASRVEENSATPSTTAAASTDALASMPSYAIAAYAPTRSLYSSASTSMFKYSNYSSTSCDSALSASTNQTNDNGGIVPDVDDEDSDNDQLEVLEEVEEEDEEGKGEENTLKATVNGVSEEINVDNSIASGETETPTWPTPLTNSLKIAPSNSIDSDNEMEIDLQHHESEADSENELIIANSEPEDNSKECESEC